MFEFEAVRFGALVRERRLAMGLSQETLAQNAFGNDKKSHVSELESGKRNLSRTSIDLVCGALGIPVMHKDGKVWIGDLPGVDDDAFRREAARAEKRHAEVMAALRQGDDYQRMRAAGITELAITSLARRIAQEVEDVGTAFRELERAVEVAIRVQSEGVAASNHGDFVDRVLTKVARLARDGQYEAALGSIDAALAQEEAESRARQVRLLDAAVEQEVLARNAPGAAARLVRKAEVEGKAGFDDLRGLLMEWFVRGRDLGLGFDLLVAIELARINERNSQGREDHGRALNDLGNLLGTLGGRESDKTRLEEAVSTFRALLEEHPREQAPVGWGVARTNLGVTLAILGTRESGKERLEEAVAAFRDSLEIRTRDLEPLDWSETQLNLGAALIALGERTSDPVLLDEAVTIFRAVLEVRTRERLPLDWAMTQMNLGNALVNLGQIEENTVRLVEAVAALRAALEVRTRERFPLDWAITQLNLGNALRFLGELKNDRGLLEDAVSAYCAALEEWTKERSPLDWAGSQMNLGIVETGLFERTGDLDYLDRAEARVMEALDIFIDAQATHHIDTAIQNLAVIRARRP